MSSPFLIHSYEINLGEYLGSGGFGVVYKGLYNDRSVAIKVATTLSNDVRYDEMIKSLKREIVTLIKIRHENIIKIHGYTVNPFQLVMELSRYGSLFDYLYKKRKKCTLDTALEWAKQCARGVAFLHSQETPILHRDLKSQNVLLFDSCQTVKICDFGISTPQRILMTKGAGTYNWMAPEVSSTKKYNIKADVYSWSMVLYEMIEFEIPFYKKDASDILDSLECGNIPTIHSSNKYVDGLHKRCSNINPEKRFSMEKALYYLRKIIKHGKVNFDD